jgi:hypothetical protein
VHTLESEQVCLFKKQYNFFKVGIRNIVDRRGRIEYRGGCVVSLLLPPNDERSLCVLFCGG